MSEVIEPVRLIPIAASLLALLLAQPATAQEQRGAIEGTVQDAQHADAARRHGRGIEPRAGHGDLDERRRDRHVPLPRARSRVLRRHRLLARIHRAPNSSTWKSSSDRSSGSRSCSRLQRVAEDGPRLGHPRRSWTRARAHVVFSLRQDTIDLLPKGRDFTSLVKRGAGGQPGAEARGHLHRRLERLGKPLRHQWHRDHEPDYRPVGSCRPAGVRRRDSGEVERVHRRIRRLHGRRHQRRDEERNQHLAWRRPGQLRRRRAQRRAATDPPQSAHGLDPR